MKKIALRWTLVAFGGFLSYYFWISDAYPEVLVVAWIQACILWMATLVKRPIPVRWQWLEIMIGLGLFLLALLPRIYNLSSYPPGFWQDEASFALSGINLIKGGEYIPYVNSTPFVIIFLVGLINTIGGVNVFVTRLFPALFGALDVAVFYFLLRERFSRSVAVIGAIFLAGSYWHLVFSRIMFEHTFYLLFILLAVWGVTRMLDGKRYWELLLILGIGIGTTSYSAFRVMVFAFGFFLVVYGLFKDKKWEYFKQLFLVGIGIVLLNIPISVFALKHPAQFFDRATTVSIFGQPLTIQAKVQELLINAGRNFELVVGFVGDPNLRQNPDGRAMNNLVVLGLALVGLISLARQSRKTFLFLVVLGLGSLVPAIVSFEGLNGFNQPHSGRTFSLLAVIYFLVAAGVGYLTTRFKGRGAVLGVVLLLIVSTTIDFRAYFNHANDPAVRYAYQTELTGSALLGEQYANQGYAVFFSPLFVDRYQVEYFMLGQSRYAWTGYLNDIPRKSVLILNSTFDSWWISEVIDPSLGSLPGALSYYDFLGDKQPQVILIKRD